MVVARKTIPRPALVALIAVAVMAAAIGVACGGGGDEGSDGGDASADTTTEVDNCTLLTNDEVSTLSDKPLFADADSPLGCPWIAEGETIADFSLRSFQSDASVADRAAELAPTLDVLELDGVGDEAVALVSDGEANFLIAKKGNLGIEMVMTFLDMGVDTENFQRAQDLANQALDRLAGS